MADYAKLAQFLGAFLLVVWAAWAQVPDNKPEQVFPTYLEPLHYAALGYRPTLMIITAGAVLICQLASGPLEKRSKNRRILQAIIDSVRSDYFPSVPEGELFKHRVTLFRCERTFRTLFQKTLVVYCRAGTHEKSKTCFKVHADEGKCEGVTGRAWYENGLVTKPGLPPWPSDAKDFPGQLAFSKAGYLSVEKARKLNIKSPAVSANIVRWQDGKKWGVLTVDSSEPGEIIKNKEHILRHYAALVGRVL